MTLKQKTYNRYLDIASQKIALLQQVLADLKESGSNETKSTAGDKHETALAMLQIEQAQKREQLKEALTQKAALDKIKPLATAAFITNGSLVKTNRGYLFMSIALGRTLVEGIAITALSPQSPLGMKLMGLTAGDTVEVNNNKYIVESIE